MKTTPQTVAAAVSLTTTLAEVGDPTPVLNLSSVLLQVAYAVGTGGTGVEYDVELSGAVAEPTTDAQWWPAEALSDQSGTASAGVLVAPRARIVHQLVTAEPRQAHTIDLRGARWLRVRAKETTGTSISAAGTITVTAYGQTGA